MMAILPIMNMYFRGKKFYDPTCGLGATLHFLKSQGFEGTGTDLYTIDGDHRDYNDPYMEEPVHSVKVANFPFIHLVKMAGKAMRSTDKNGMKIPCILLVPNSFISNAGSREMLVEHDVYIIHMTGRSEFLVEIDGKKLKKKPGSHCWLVVNVPELKGQYEIFKLPKVDNNFPHHEDSKDVDVCDEDTREEEEENSVFGADEFFGEEERSVEDDEENADDKDFITDGEEGKDDVSVVTESTGLPDIDNLYLTL
jgi:hypothetical protein